VSQLFYLQNTDQPQSCKGYLVCIASEVYFHKGTEGEICEDRQAIAWITNSCNGWWRKVGGDVKLDEDGTAQRTANLEYPERTHVLLPQVSQSASDISFSWITEGRQNS
jgi:hypothetical protein